jgi:hypothetical protein
MAKRLTGSYTFDTGLTIKNVKETRYATTTSGNVTLDLANGNLVVAVYAKGTPEEREAAATAARRATLSCSPRQARLALAQSNLLDAVDAFVQAGDAALKIEWEYATEIRRDWPPVAAFAAASGMDEAIIDGLFTLAATL